MKNFTIIKSLLLIVAFAVTFNASAQLHSPPDCGENYTLDWSRSPSDSNDYAWSSGSLSNTYNNVDDSGINISVAFTGDTSSFGSWEGEQTPKVGNSSSGLFEGLDLYTRGFSSTGITCTFTFSTPIYALSFDMHHVNQGGPNGDKYTIWANTTSGATIQPIFTNSSNPSYTTNNATGVIDANKGSVNGTDAIVGVNFSDSEYITSITFLWQDCSICSPNNVHGSGLGNLSFCIPQTLDFDGVNDYINRAAFLGGKSEATMMTWIKLDNNFDGGEVMGQRNFRVFINSNRRLKTFVKTTGSNSTATTLNSDAPVLSTNLWYHVASVYSASDSSLELFLNGKSVWKSTGLSGSAINNSNQWNANHDFEIGRNTQGDDDYFEGAIYETRVYNKALNLNQLQRQINQEIENHLGNVRGSVIPIDIDGLLWNNLELYYKMGIIDTGFTPDASSLGVAGKLNNMRTYQERTAPLPYVTTASSNGDWSNPNNWEYGDVWDITSIHPESAIVQIKGQLEMTNEHKTLGLILDRNAKLTVKGDVGLFNSYYLKLDGKIDLEGESQLIQTAESVLDATSSGTLEKDQQGTADKFTYNYWSSPVGVSNNISNNNSYKVTDIFSNVEFTSSGFDGSASPLKIADYWIFKYNNRPTDNYSQWQQVRSSGTLNAGEGFTMKGSGAGAISDEQNYVLEGKPNNGDINLTINSGNDYLIGNPYPSAIDAEQFIRDNGPTIAGTDTGSVINGTLYFWEHWGGGSHNLSDYQGGYATYTLSGGVPAASKGTNDPDVATGGSPTKTPGRYIPVGQGFFVTAESNGVVNFNNGQRIFQKEDGTNSLFVKSENNKAKVSSSSDSKDERLKIRLGFNSVNEIHRQLLVTADSNATLGKDWGYDARNNETQIDDMYWMIEDDKFVIQGLDTISQSTILPIGMHTKTRGINTITIDKLENVPDDLEIYLYDTELDVYHNLRQDDYKINLDKGEYLNRFKLAFTNQKTLSNTDIVANNEAITIYYNNKVKSLNLYNPKSIAINSIAVYNILGQTVYESKSTTKSNEENIGLSGLVSGVYVVNLESETGNISKKILVKSI
ncbi:T9SS type A sorting domain-containing protein [Algibacter sp.]|nr:T9SS type A sorting domain-containing protein [Algibacter sp.]